MNIFLKVYITCHIFLLHLPDALSVISVGGYPTTIDHVPFLVQLWIGRHFICGGTLLSARFVVTAAHCVNRLLPSDITVKAGASDLSDPGIVSAVSRFAIPKKFDKSDLYMDFAVLKLKNSLEFESVKTASLCPQNWQPGDAVHVYGWGKKYYGGLYNPDQLNTIELNTLSMDNCANFFYTNYRALLTNSVFCAAAPGKNACNGDSGGPVVVNGQFCGIVSWSVRCDAGFPAVFTDVAKLRSFIRYGVNLLNLSD